MRKRTWCALLVGALALLFLVHCFGVDRAFIRSFGIDNPNLPRIKRVGDGIVIEIPEEENEDD